MTITYALPIPAQANLRSKLSAQRGRSQNRREAGEFASSHRRKPVSSSPPLLDSGVRRNDGKQLVRGATL